MEIKKQADLIRPAWEERITELLGKMTLDEKIGQPHQVGPSPVGGFAVSLEEHRQMLADGRITQEEFDAFCSGTARDTQEQDVREGRIGSFLGVSGAEACDHLQHIAVEESRLGIPLLFGLDVIHGQHTIFPIPLAESCAWDEALWEKSAAIAAAEATADGIAWTFAPMVDIARDARWGRIAEGAGEDSYLGARCAAARVRGSQGEDPSAPDRVLSCAKHFIAYGAACGGRDHNNADLSEQTLREVYLPPFSAALAAGAATVMPSFNDVNGVPSSVNTFLLRQILREELGFSGFTVSDANAIAECVIHGAATDRRDAAKQALAAGMDMDMYSGCYRDELKALIEAGQITVAQLDEAVRRVLRIKFAKGLFDHPYTRHRLTAADLAAHRAAARDAACASAVLLKNDGVLPLLPKTPVLLVGKLADCAGEMLGTWNIYGRAEETVSIKAALEEEGVLAGYLPCCGPDMPLDRDELTQAIRSETNTVIAVVGELADHSGEAASLCDLDLPGEQNEMLTALRQAGKTVITVLCNGRPMAIPNAVERSDALLELWHAGSEAGHAAADLLFGRAMPAGRLTATFPYRSGECPLYYDHPNTGRPLSPGRFSSKYLDAPLEPLFPFGFGLTYTTFAYDDLRCTADEQGIHAAVTVKNTGGRAAKETVQLYIRDLVASRVRPVLQLAGYRQILLAPGQAERVCLTVEPERLAFYDTRMRRVIEPGDFLVQAGHSSADGLQQTVTVSADLAADYLRQI